MVGARSFRAALAVLGVAAAALVPTSVAGGAPPTATQPTLTIVSDCDRFEDPIHSAYATVRGLPPFTRFEVSFGLPGGGGVGPSKARTDANGTWSQASSYALFGSFEPGDFTWTIVWSGGTLTKSRYVDCSPIDAGADFTCGVGHEHTLACWGNNSSGKSSPPAGTFSTVSAGGRHACGIRPYPYGTTVTCWGANGRGQATPPEGNFHRVSAGGFHTCGVTYDAIACWGRNGSGQANPPGVVGLAAISAGGFHTCAVLPAYDDLIDCWGSGNANPPAGKFTAVSAGDFHTCALRKDGDVACWGQNRFGQANAPGGSFIDVSAGGGHSCGVRPSGTVTCWGRNSRGQATPPTGRFVEVSAGGAHTCGLRTNGVVACWGDNSSGQSTPPAGFP